MKKKIFRYRLAVYACMSLFMMTACSDWLDVKPKTEVEAEKLFETQDGFKEALAGVYTCMTQKTLYGREMTFGLLDAVAQQWNLTTSDNTHVYYDASNYDYESTTSRPIMDTIWSQCYRTIANANSILEFVDQKNVFTGDNREIIKGEALAIRAFMHFDLLRMFAADAVSTADADGIPYVSELSKQVTKSVSPKQMITNVVTDLNAALKCLEVDPVLTGREITEDDDHGYLINRSYHLNYYAVAGLLARVQLYAGNYTEAAKYAHIVVDAHRNDGKFPWIESTNISTDSKEARDFTFSTEQLFALNIRKMTEYTNGFLTATDRPLLFRIGKTTLMPNPEYRREYLFEEGSSNLSIKLLQVKNSKFAYRMPMIRLSEMYYILAECANRNAGQAGDDPVSLLNEVLTARGYETQYLLDPSVVNTPKLIQDEILKEYQREFICEGQLFFYHKRVGDVSLNDKPVKYVFPKPENEIEFGK